MKKATEDLIEMIIVRLNRISDADVVRGIFTEVIEAFRQPVCQYSSARLYMNEQVVNEWAIYLHHPAKEGEGKSTLSEILVETLRSVGLVHHTVWKPCDADDRNEGL